MPYVAQGGTKTVDVLVYNGSGQPIDAQNLSLQIRNPSNVVVYGPFAEPTIVHDGLGAYHYDWTTSISEVLGTWRAEWSGLVLGSPVQTTELWEVVAPGTIVTEDYSYDPSTDVGLVRLYIDDRDMTRVDSSVPLEQRSAIFSNNEIQAFLDAAAGSVHYAAALGLITIAGNRQLLVMSRRIGRTTLEFGNVRRDLVAQAKELVKIANELNGGVFAPADAVAQIAYTDFSYRHIIWRNASLGAILAPSLGG